MTRSLHELMDTTEPAWPLVREWLDAADGTLVLPADRAHGGSALHALQVSLRSPMGAVVYHTTGILLDHGWLRVLGSGDGLGLPSIVEATAWFGLGGSESSPPGAIVTGIDLLGGCHLVDGGVLGADTAGQVYFFAPDTLEFECLGMGYSAWLRYMCSGKLGEFYTDLRWPGWQSEVPADPGRGVHVYPPPGFAGPPISQRSRRDVPLQELVGIALETRTQLLARADRTGGHTGE